MSVEGIEISNELYRYAVEHTLREADILRELREETLALPGGQMMSSPEQVQFIAMLIKLMQAKQVLEVGTFTGYASLAMAMALAPEGKLTTCDIDHQAPAIGQRYWQQAGVISKIQLVTAPALTLLDAMILQGQANQYDLAYIDADKQNNHHYFEKLLLLIRPGGVLIIDNVLWKGRVIDSEIIDARTQSIRRFNEALYQDQRVELSMLTMGDGLTLARKV